VALIVRTARIGAYTGDDAFNVTRGSGGEAGHPFAPSWGLLTPFKKAQRRGDFDDATWDVYVAAYADEMRRSYRTSRRAWEALLARPSAVLLCYCRRPDRCHRSVLALILAQFGATYEGEYMPPPKPAPQLEMGPFGGPFRLRETPGGEVVATGFVCGVRKRKCRGCGQPAPYLCDFQLTGALAGKTCDIPMCPRCAHEVGPDRHYCRVHNEMANEEVLVP
jgi:hypothetical protein